MMYGADVRCPQAPPQLPPGVGSDPMSLDAQQQVSRVGAAAGTWAGGWEGVVVLVRRHRAAIMLYQALPAAGVAL